MPLDIFTSVEMIRGERERRIVWVGFFPRFIRDTFIFSFNSEKKNFFVFVFLQIDESLEYWRYCREFRPTFSVSGKETKRQNTSDFFFCYSVRWIGEIENMPMIGLQSLNLALPGQCRSLETIQ